MRIRASTDQEALVKSLAPVVVYHPKERFFIADVNEYFARTRAMENADGEAGRVLRVPEGEEVGDGVIRDLGGTPLTDYYYATVDNETHCHYALLPAGAGDTEHYYIQYYLFYPYNGPKRILGLVPTGQHTADIETVAVKVRAVDNVPVEFNMTNHGDFVRYRLDNSGGQNKLVPAATIGPEDAPVVQVDEKGHPVIYTALNGHGLYNETGSYLRFGVFGNDVCGDGPRTLLAPVELKDDNEALQWEGHLGDDGVNSFYTRMTPAEEKHVPRAPRSPLAAANAAFLIYLVVPVLVFVLLRSLTRLSVAASASLAALAFAVQLYVLKGVITLLFSTGVLGLPPPNPDTWSRWLIPLRLD